MKTNKKPTVISVFAGCGGSSLGYKFAGYRELLAIDFDRHAVETFRENFPNVPIWKKDVTKITGKEMMSFCGIKRGELDVFDGSPPCQGFSMSGKRVVVDGRNSLFLAFASLLSDIHPKIFVMENVAGMVAGRMRGVFKDAMSVLRGCGYNVKCWVANSKNYGVPQSRKRAIFIGVRSNIGLSPSFPKPFNTIFNAGIAIADIDNSDEEIILPQGFVLKYFDLISPGKRLADIFKDRDRYYGLRKLDSKKPSYTIGKMFARGMAGVVHWSEKRFLTIAEVKRLCSFPDDFILRGKFEERWARLGNSVMPKFMECIASHIKKTILDKLDAGSKR